MGRLWGTREWRRPVLVEPHSVSEFVLLLRRHSPGPYKASRWVCRTDLRLRQGGAPANSQVYSPLTPRLPMVAPGPPVMHPVGAAAVGPPGIRDRTDSGAHAAWRPVVPQTGKEPTSQRRGLSRIIILQCDGLACPLGPLLCGGWQSTPMSRIVRSVARDV